MRRTMSKESPLLLLPPRLQGWVAQRLSVGFQLGRSPVLVPEVSLLLSMEKVLVGEESEEEEVMMMMMMMMMMMTTKRRLLRLQP